MIRWTRMALVACALPVAAIAQNTINFPSRATGNEGTAIAVEAGGEAERSFQAEKERQRVKAEAERVAREAAERKAAEEARIERERVELERRATEEAERVANAAAAAEQARALQARMDAVATPGELLALSDELKSKGDIEGSRAALRAIVAKFPDHRYADMAVTMLTGMAPPPAAPAPAVAGTTEAPATLATPAATPPAPAARPSLSQPAPANACLAVLSRFSAARPASPGGVSTPEREVFYGTYYAKLLDAAPACRADTATATQIRDGIARNLEACKKIAGANCTVGVPDTAVGNVDAAYEEILGQLEAAPAAPPPARPAPPPPPATPATTPVTENRQ